MKSKLLFPTLIALLSFGSGLTASAAPIIVPLASRANDMAAAFLGSPATFKTGDTFNPLSIGNVNTLPTRQQGVLKFDISTFASEPASSVKLNLKVDYLVDNTPTHLFPVQTINVYALNYDLTAAAFTYAALDTSNVTLLGSFSVSATGNISFDLTAGFAAAQANDFNFLSLRFENQTVLNGPFGNAAFVGFSVVTPNIEVTAVPEPSTYALLGIALFALVGLAKRKGLNEIGK
jgi:hypothetical protein